MIEGLRLRFGRWGSSEGGLGFGRGGGMRKEIDFLADGTTKIVEGFANVGRVIIGFVGVLRTV